MTLTRETLELRLRGVLRRPTDLAGFALSVQDIRLGTEGLRFPAASDDAGPVPQSVGLYGGTLTLRRGASGAALALAWENNALRVRMSGSLQLLGRPAMVNGLTLGSDGTVALQSAEGFTVIPALSGSGDPVAAVSTVSAAEDGTLQLQGRVVLPAPFRAQQADGGGFTLGIGLNGVPDRARVTVWDQPAGCCETTNRAMFALGAMVRLHARRLEVVLDLNDMSRSVVALVADAYVGSTDEARRDSKIAFGQSDGNVLHPGLSVAFDGTVTLGNVSVERAFTVGVQALALTVQQASIPSALTFGPSGVGTTAPFSLVLGGTLSLDIRAVTGAIAFRDVTISASGVSFAPTSLQAARLSIAGALSLELNDLLIVTRDTTVSIAPTSGDGPARTVAVSGLVMFGGRMTLDGAGLSGGVERFLFYRTQSGLTALIIKQATLSIPNTLAFAADFEFEQKPDGFAMALGATGTLLEKVEVGLYGMVSRSTSDGTRFGMFLRSRVVIPLVPGVLTVSELGGGFFYRPRDADLDGAWSAAALDPSLRSLGGNVPRNPNAGAGLQFAVLLYGAVDLGGAAVNGRTLITVTNAYFEILAQVQLLGQNSLQGSARLQLGFNKPYVEGDIRLRVQVPGALSANATLLFFAYGGDQWGILGNVNATLVGVVQASGRLFIGPPGFLITVSATYGVDVSVIKAGAGIRASFWYIRTGSGTEVGGFASAYVYASVLGGLAEIEAGLRGGFLVQSGNWLVYCSAYVEVKTPVGDFEGSLWVKLENGTFDGGLGRDATMDRLVARAAAVEQQMQNAARAAEQTLTAAQNAAKTVSVSSAELTRAFEAFIVRDSITRTWLVGGARVGERTTDPTDMEPGWPRLLDAYVGALTGTGGSESVFLNRAARPNLDSLEQSLSATRTQVIARLRTVATTVRQQARQPLPAVPNDPVGDSLPASIAVQELPTGERRAAMPVLKVDLEMAAQARAYSAAALAEGRISARELLVAIDSMERTMAGLDLLIRADGPESFVTFAERHNRVREEVELYVRSTVAEAQLRNRFADSAVRTIAAVSPALRLLVPQKTQRLVNAGNWGAIYTVLLSRAVALQRLGVAGINVGELASTYQGQPANLRPSLRANADTLGLALWARFGDENILRLRDSTRARLASIENGPAVRALADFQQAHVELSRAAAELFDAQADLFVTLYDAYDTFVDAFMEPSGNILVNQLPISSVAFTNVLNRQRYLRQVYVDRTIAAPSLYVNAMDRMGWGLVRADLYPKTSRPDAFFVSEGPAAGPPGPWLLIGRAQSVRFGVAQPDATTTNEARVFRVAQRAGVGFESQRTIPYSARFMLPGTTVGTGIVSSTQWDVTPPSAPTFTPAGGAQFTAPWGPFAGRALLYAPPNDRLEMRWSATASTGISNWEVGFGTSPDSADLLPVRFVGARTSETLAFPRTMWGKPLFWRGRARSGDGIWGPFGASPAVVVDTVAPKIAPSTDAVQIGAVGPSGLVTLATQAVQVATLMIAQPWGLTACPGRRRAGEATFFEAPPMPARSVTVSWPLASRDAGAPATWWWRVDSTLAPPGPGFTASGGTVTAVGAPTVAVDSRQLSYRRPVRMTFMARNASGVASAPVSVLLPQLTNDQTPPAAPSFCSTTISNAQVQLTPSAAATDAETDVVGYQFEIRRGVTVLRPFPTGTMVDIPASRWIPGQSLTLSVAGGPYVVPAADGDSSLIAVRVRTINAAGIPSQAAAERAAGPRLPAPVPVVQATSVEVTALVRRTRYVTFGAAASATPTGTPIYDVAVQRPGQSVPGPWQTLDGNTWSETSTLRAPLVLHVRARTGAGSVSSVVQVAVDF
jgi:hypothetical protein